jgi:TonB family protein
MTKADRTVDKTLQPERPTRWIIVPVLVAALFIVAWIGSKFMGHPSSTPSGDSGAIIQHAPPADGAVTQSSSPSTATAHGGAMRGSVLHQTMPDISRGAQSTIRGRVKVSVQVAVDPSGKVSQAKLVSPGPSRYFAARSLAAARLWKFNPPQVNGQASFSEWILRFEFGRTSTKVSSSETKP